MKINKLTRLKENIFELNYTNFWGFYKMVKIYKHVFRWKVLATGKDLSFNISSSLSEIALDLEIGESFTTN